VDVLTTEDAAARLGVSTRRVRSLIEQGDLVAERVGRMYLIRAESVAELAMRRASGRSLSSRMSWAVLLSDLGRTNWGVVSVEHRLSRTDRQRVLALRGRAVEDWAWLARRRAVTTRHVVRDGYIGRLLDDSRIVRSGLSALRDHDVALTEQAGEAEFYVAAAERDHLLGDYLARADAAGRVIVHAVDADVIAHIRRAGGSVMTAMTVGVDLAESADTRTRRAGHNLIQRVAHG
jgi:excisionase family DNA binding protein